MAVLEEDSDEEWAQIAAEINIFEAQYIAARNSALSGDNLTSNAPTTPNHAASNHPPSSATHVGPQRQTNDFRNEQTWPLIQPSDTDPPHVPPPPNVSSGLLREGAPLESNGVECDANRGAKAGNGGGPAIVDEDPFSRILCQKETELYKLREEMNGVQANFRNKIRSLQQQLHEARSVQAASALATSNSESLERVTQLTEEKTRLQRELDEARDEAHKQSAALQFTQQELASLKDRERSLTAALRSKCITVPEDSAPPVPIVPALTQPGDVVEGTQVPKFGATQNLGASMGFIRPTSRRRKRPSSSQGNLGSGLGLSQPATKMESRVAVENDGGDRKQRSGNLDRNNNKDIVIELKPSIGVDSKNRVSTVQNVASNEIQHGWGIDFGSDVSVDQSIREHLFKTGFGESLMQLAQRTTKEGFGRKVSQALAGECDWTETLDTLASTIFVGRTLCLTALQAVDVLLTFNVDCRVHAASFGDKEDGIVATCVKALDLASKSSDAEVAELCLRILEASVAGVSEGSDGGDSVESVSKKMCCVILGTDSWINWASGSKGASGKGGRIAGIESGEGCRVAAWRLMESICGVAIEAQSHMQDSEWSMVERSYSEAAELLEKGGDDTVVELAIGMMARASAHAPYLVTDLGGANGLCSTLGRLVRWLQRDEEADREDLKEFADGGGTEDVKVVGESDEDWFVLERRRVMGAVRVVVGALTMAGVGMGGKLGISATGQIAGKGALSLLGWNRGGWVGTPKDVVDDTEFGEECRRAWDMVDQCVVELPVDSTAVKTGKEGQAEA